MVFGHNENNVWFAFRKKAKAGTRDEPSQNYPNHIQFLVYCSGIGKYARKIEKDLLFSGLRSSIELASSNSFVKSS
jgi:hypothetical protein